MARAGRAGGSHETRNTTVRAKRAAVSPRRLKERHENGEDTTGARALVRLGTSSTEVLSGKDDLSQWTDEELRRGQKKDKNGKWQGKKPIVVPLSLHQELSQRLMSQAQELMRDNLMEAVKVLVEICTGPNFEAKDRLKAVQMITDRVMGKAPETVNLNHGGDNPPWVVALLGGIVTVPQKDGNDAND